jgi:RecA/RadA recombinase
MAKPIEPQKFTTKAEKIAAMKADMRSRNKALGLEGLSFASDLPTSRRAAFGIPELDKKIGGGLLHGTFSCVWGGEGSGKSTDGYMLTAQAQKEGKTVVWIALERFFPERAIQFEVNLDELVIVQVPKAEQALDVIIDYARRGLADVIILDSIHSLAPKAAQEDSKGEKSMESDTMALLARKLSQFFPIASDPIKRNDVCVLLIGQTRTSVGLFSIEQLTGGFALKHNCRLIIKQTRTKDDAPSIKVLNEETQKNETVLTGFGARFRFDKVQIPGCVTEGTVVQLPYYFESGFNDPSYIKEQEAEIAAQDGPQPEAPNEEVTKKRGRAKKG